MLSKHFVQSLLIVGAGLAALPGCKSNSSQVAAAQEEAVATTPPKAYGMFAATVKPQFGKTLEYGIYLIGASQTLPAYKAHAVAWGKDHISFEGNYKEGYIMVLEFPSVERFKTWYANEPYKSVKKIRMDATDPVMSILHEGVAATADASTVTPKGSQENKAFVILNNNITDSSAYAAYLAKSDAVIKQYGGRTVVQGQDLEMIEGTVKPDNIEMYEFTTMADLQTWYKSPENQALIPERQKASNVVFLIGQQGIPQL